MNEKKVLELLNKNDLEEQEWEIALEQIKDKNKYFLVEMLMLLKNDELDKIEQELENERQFRVELTSLLNVVGKRYQFYHQISVFVNTWNIFNKILEVENEKELINKEIQTLFVNMPVVRNLMNYLYRNLRVERDQVKKELGYNESEINLNTNLMYEKGIIYKTSVKNKVMYDLTENGRQWIKKYSESDIMK